MDAGENTVRWNYRGTFQIASSPDVDGALTKWRQPQPLPKENNFRNNSRSVFQKIDKPAIGTEMPRRDRVIGFLHAKRMRVEWHAYPGTQQHLYVLNRKNKHYENKEKQDQRLMNSYETTHNRFPGQKMAYYVRTPQHRTEAEFWLSCNAWSNLSAQSWNPSQAGRRSASRDEMTPQSSNGLSSRKDREMRHHVGRHLRYEESPKTSNGVS